MLVLSRNPGERLVLEVPAATTIRIEICEVRGKRVILGVDVLREVVVTREELLTKQKPDGLVPSG